MTPIDIINRINEAIRAGDQLDLDDLATEVCDLVIEERERVAWLALIETASESIDGMFR